MNIEKLITEINRLRPFVTNTDDPYVHGQNDTIERVLNIVYQLMGEL